MSSALSLLHHDQKMLAHGAQPRPSGCAAIQTPQPLVEFGVFVVCPSEVGRWSESAQSPMILQRELLLERRVELAREVVPRPDRVIVHVDRDEAASEPDRSSSPATAQR